jgi:hypothetical protein
MKHLRFLHYFLKDKKNYHRDQELARSWEIYTYYLDQVRKMSWYLIKMKIFYFVRYKKLYILRVLTFFSIFLALTFYGGRYILENNSFFTVKRVVTNSPVDTIYVPDTISIDEYQRRIMRISSISEDEMKSKLSFVIYYTIDTNKTAEKWLKRLAYIESTDNIKAVNGDYWGMWQMGPSARKSVGFGGVSLREYLASYEVQRASVIIYLKNNYRILKPYILKYDNKMFRGYHLTMSGMLAMSHNCGPQGVIDFLNNGYVPQDSGKPLTRYLSLGNYDVYDLLQDK